MDINKVLMEYDNMFGEYSQEDIYRFLVRKIEEAYEENALFSAVQLLSEMCSFCRNYGNMDDGKTYCKQLVGLMNSMNLQGTIEYATAILNVANSYRTFGMFKESLKYYQVVEDVYKAKLEKGSFDFAGLYNNWALLYQQIKDYERAEKMLRRAMAIIDKLPNEESQQAVIRTNLAVTLLNITDKHIEKDESDQAEHTYSNALEFLRQAIDMFERENVKDNNYSGALATMGDALCYREDYSHAAEYYLKAMSVIEKCDGRTENYFRIKQNYDSAMKLVSDANETKFWEEHEKIKEERKAKNAEKKVKKKAELQAEVDRASEEVEDAAPEVEENKQTETVEVAEDKQEKIEDAAPEVEENNQTETVEVVNAEQEINDIVNQQELAEETEATNAQREIVDEAEITESDLEDEIKEDVFSNIRTNQDELYELCGRVFNGNMRRCYEFYLNKVADMIHRRYPVYEKKIAVGVVGEGSDCFGFDDYISADNDYCVGLCLWLEDANYAQIGEKLQSDYRELLPEEEKINYDRRGVYSVNDFYQLLIGEDVCSKKLGEDFWMNVDEAKLATALNGCIFKDDSGIFTEVRNKLLAYYPDRVWRLRIAEQLNQFSQNAQSNYGKMMARADYVAVELCISQALKAAMSLLYLINRKYAPYYKWMRRGLEDMNIPRNILSCLDDIAVLPKQIEAWKGMRYKPGMVNRRDRIAVDFEKLAEYICGELKKLDIISGNGTKLDMYSKQIMAEDSKIWLNIAAGGMDKE